MERRKVSTGLWTTAPPPSPVEGQVVRIEGRAPLTPGGEVTVKGIGRCTFTGVVNSDGSIEVLDGKRKAFRSAPLSRVQTVHTRTEKLRQAKDT
jgi:hypothetical protein